MSRHPTPLWAYGAVDVEGILCVPRCYVEGQEGIWSLVRIPGEDAGDKAGDGGVLAESEVHREVEEHGVVVIDVQHTDAHHDLPGREVVWVRGTHFHPCHPFFAPPRQDVGFPTQPIMVWGRKAPGTGERRRGGE